MLVKVASGDERTKNELIMSYLFNLIPYVTIKHLHKDGEGRKKCPALNNMKNQLYQFTNRHFIYQVSVQPFQRMSRHIVFSVFADLFPVYAPVLQSET